MTWISKVEPKLQGMSNEQLEAVELCCMIEVILSILVLFLGFSEWVGVLSEP